MTESLRPTAAPVHRTRRVLWLSLGVLAGTVALSPATADIYKRIDSRGVAHYTDEPQGKGWTLILRTPKAAPKKKSKRGPSRYTENRKRWTPVIDKVAAARNIDAALVHAVVMAESAYDARAVSPKGAAGLMQLMPATAERYGVSDRFDGEQNVDGGVRYLIDLLRMFDDVRLAIAAYNAGEGAVERYDRAIPPFPETREYVRRVLANYKKLTRDRSRS